jgi:hypothetical protein
MSVDEIEHYCASIITGTGAWEVPPAPPSTRATTPTPEDNPQPFITDDSVLRAFTQFSNAESCTGDISSPCINTLIFSASEEENLQDLLTNLKHLPPGSNRPSSKYMDEGTRTLAALDGFMSELYSGARPSSGQTGADVTRKSVPYEPLSPISPFLGGRDAGNQSFSTSTPRGPKSITTIEAEIDTSMIMDTTRILDTTMILDDYSMDTIRLAVSAGMDPPADAGARNSASASASANINRRWSAKIKDRGKPVQEPNTPPHTPLGVLNGILRARAVHAERRQQRRQEKRAEKEQADPSTTAAAGAGASAHARRGHAWTGSSVAGKV